MDLTKLTRKELKEVAELLLPQLDKRRPATPIRISYKGNELISHNPLRTAVELAKAFARLNEDGDPARARGKPAKYSAEMIAASIEFLIRHRGMKPGPAVELVTEITGHNDPETVRTYRRRHRATAEEVSNIKNISMALPADARLAVEEILRGTTEYSGTNRKVHLGG